MLQHPIVDHNVWGIPIILIGLIVWQTPAKGDSQHSAKVPEYPGWSLGFSATVPEGVRFDFGKKIDPHWQLRFFTGIPLESRINLRLPARDLAAKSGFRVAHPPIDLNFKMVWGPSFGVEPYYFPFGSPYYIATGLGFESLLIRGQGRTPAVICSDTEVSCADANHALVTASKLSLSALYQAYFLRGRVHTGYFWPLGPHRYMNLSLGITSAPLWRQSELAVNSRLLTETFEEDAIYKSALDEFSALKEQELENDGIKELDRVLLRPLPVLGLGAGWRF